MGELQGEAQPSLSLSHISSCRELRPGSCLAKLGSSRTGQSPMHSCVAPPTGPLGQPDLQTQLGQAAQFQASAVRGPGSFPFVLLGPLSCHVRRPQLPVSPAGTRPEGSHLEGSSPGHRAICGPRMSPDEECAQGQAGRDFSLCCKKIHLAVCVFCTFNTVC